MSGFSNIFRLLGIAFVLAASASPAAASEKLPDGRWHITLRGHGPYWLCYGQITHVGEVRRGRPVYKGQARYTFTLTRSGRLTASGARKADRANLHGRLRGKHGEGTFNIPTRNCRGTWRVVRISD